MPKAKTAKPKYPKMQKFTLQDFEKNFPDDDACLEWLKNHLYPNGIFCVTCQRVTKHHKTTSRRCYTCDYCGLHVHPTANDLASYGSQRSNLNPHNRSTCSKKASLETSVLFSAMATEAIARS